MRLYLLPISTRRTLLYAHRVGANAARNESYVDRAAGWAARKWEEWETRDKGWQKHVVSYGNAALRRIPYEEWGLKSVPPLSKRRIAEVLGSGAGTKAKAKVELVYPPSVIGAHRAEAVLRTLGTERHSFHRQRMIWCIIGMPISAPFALVPVVPNIPFFYLVYRAWSHWRAISGGKHIRWLLDNNLVLQSPSKSLDAAYTNKSSVAELETDGPERMLITEKHIPGLARQLDIPALHIELERAVWQVEQSLKKDKPPRSGGDKAKTDGGKEGKQD
ncbi:mitochondrial K+-H+ exchange-related-domain-containing protein [Stachybotrys elegans]|uniref:Mitochondrial K+-H+ exchange-related-domain-containing protein n=1 Tax=Stachybotrys elegans TaxID=80388 RepID=A0A8K0T1B6_9HYPO|nr:mitochondrial K+-H+ exchange-related-domain-containing protein [Stachybotrys elegans]